MTKVIVNGTRIGRPNSRIFGDGKFWTGVAVAVEANVHVSATHVTTNDMVDREIVVVVLRSVVAALLVHGRTRLRTIYMALKARSRELFPFNFIKRSTVYARHSCSSPNFIQSPLPRKLQNLTSLLHSINTYRTRRSADFLS